MKVLHVININAVGGAEKLLISFLPALKSNGADILCAILCPSKSKDAAVDICFKLEKSGIKVCFKEYDLLMSITNFIWLFKIYRINKPTLVHTHLRYADIWMVVLKVFGFLKCPIVSTVHGYNDAYMNKYGLKVSKGIRFTLYYWVTRLVARKADGLIFISNCMKEFYEKSSFLGKTKNIIIYHGYSVNELLHGGNKMTINSDELKLVLPGRIVERKGHKYALEALAVLRKNKINVSLHFLGEGPYKEKLQKDIVRLDIFKYVNFHGYKDNIIQELRKYDIAVLPSYWEPFGLVFLDAFASKLPVVAFNMPAGNEIIENESNGLLVPPFSTQGLVNAISKLYADKDMRLKLGNKGYQDLITKFTIPEMANKYVSFYCLISNSE